MSSLIDCLQINPGRAGQRALTWAVNDPEHRRWREATREEITGRQTLFTELLAGTGWEIPVQGGYFAYVKHPFPGASSELVASRLGQYVGVTVLPGTFFAPPFENVEDDRYLRFCGSRLGARVLPLPCFQARSSF